MMIGPLALKLPYGGFNGGKIVNPSDMSVVEEICIPPDVVKQAVGVFQQNNIDCWVFVGNEWLIVNPDGDEVQREINTIHTPPTIVPEFTESHFQAVGKIVGPSEDHARIIRVTDELQGLLAGRASAARSQPYYCDVIPPGIDKGRLVELLGERLGIPRSEILVLGDMENDMEMFRKAGFAVAMGNATDDVKELAQAVTLSNEEDGFAAAIDRYVFGG
jgi:Cof subfamily protein (haloacid dehalogenase superfamily)